MCSLRDAAKELGTLGVRTLGVSLDDVATQKQFSKTQELGFPLLSDPDGSAASKYHALAGLGTYAKRITFVIDPKGVIRHVDRSVDISKHGGDLVAVIRRLQQG